MMLARSVSRDPLYVAPPIGDAARAETAELTVGLARGPADLQAAQRLRYSVFAGEMGANLGDAEAAIDQDEFDMYCDHLLVREGPGGRVVGTYRILPPHRREQLGRFYSEGEFDLRGLRQLQASMIEVGRSCVHPEHRDGSAILLLWAGLAQYMRKGQYKHLIGCASVSLADGGMQAAALRDRLQSHLADSEYRVSPREPFVHGRIARAATLQVPPLIKGYLRLGASVCGEPAWDREFNSADFLIWLSMENLQPRYARHFNLLATQGEAVSV